jgi:hypothetical protein
VYPIIERTPLAFRKQTVEVGTDDNKHLQIAKAKVGIRELASILNGTRFGNDPATVAGKTLPLGPRLTPRAISKHFVNRWSPLVNKRLHERRVITPDPYAEVATG